MKEFKKAILDYINYPANIHHRERAIQAIMIWHKVSRWQACSLLIEALKKL